MENKQDKPEVADESNQPVPYRHMNEEGFISLSGAHVFKAHGHQPNLAKDKVGSLVKEANSED